jgi:hypothetical protein
LAEDIIQTYRVHCLSSEQIVKTCKYEARDDPEAVILLSLRRKDRL